MSTACTGWAHSNRSDGYGNAAQDTHLYTGPYAACSYVTAIKSGVKVYYHCYVTNAQGNKWIYARIAGTNTEGWVFSDKVHAEERHTRPLLKRVIQPMGEGRTTAAADHANGPTAQRHVLIGQAGSLVAHDLEALRATPAVADRLAVARSKSSP